MKRFLSGVLAASMLCGVLAGCGENEPTETTDDNISELMTDNITSEIELVSVYPYILNDFTEAVDIGDGRTYTKYYVLVKKSEDDFVSQADLKSIFNDVVSKNNPDALHMVVFYYDSESLERDKGVDKEYVYLIEDTSGYEKTNNDPNTYSPPESNAQNTSSESGSELLDLADSLNNCVGSDEYITSVTLNDKVLKIVVDLSHADLGFLSIDDLAYSRASSITDEILNHSELDSSWDRINLDFGTTGRIEIGKDAIKTNEYGMRYMDLAKFRLQ